MSDPEADAVRAVHTPPDNTWPPPGKLTIVRGGGNGRQAMCQFGLCRSARTRGLTTVDDVAQAEFGVLEGVQDGSVKGVRDACGGCCTRLGLSNRIDLRCVTPEQCVGRIFNHMKDGRRVMTRAEIHALLTSSTHCAVTGRPFTETEDNYCHFGSIDRIDSTLPYEKGNVMVLSTAANAAKSNCSPRALMERCKEIAYARASAPGPFELPRARLGGDIRVPLQLSGSDGVVAGTGRPEIILVTAGDFRSHKKNSQQHASRRNQEFWPAFGGDEKKKKDAYYTAVIGPVATATGDPTSLSEPERGFWCGRLLSGMRSLDRAFNGLGYGAPEQVHLLCCSDCNAMRKQQTMEQFELMCALAAKNEKAYLAAVETERARCVHPLPPLDDTNMCFNPKSKDDAGVRNVRGMVAEMYRASAEIDAGTSSPSNKRKRMPSWSELARRAGVAGGSCGHTTDIIRELIKRRAGHRVILDAVPQSLAGTFSNRLPYLLP